MSDDQMSRETPSEKFRNISLAVAGLISSIFIPLVGVYFTDRQHENDSLNRAAEEKRQDSLKFIELGINILSQHAEHKGDPVRKWAIETINSYSEVKFSDAAQQALQSQPLGLSMRQNIDVDSLKSQGYTVGVDLSSYAGDVDFGALKKTGYSFVYIKATEGVNQTDPSFAKYAADARKAGLLVGFYHSFRDRDVDGESEYFVKTISNQSSDLPPAIGAEQAIKIDKTLYSDDLYKFAKLVHTKSGHKPVIYTYSQFAEDLFQDNISEFPLWIAQYTPAPKLPQIWHTFTFWQRATEGAFDIDVFKGSDVELRNLMSSID